MDIKDAKLYSTVTHPNMGICAIVGVDGKYIRVKPINCDWSGECPADELTSIDLSNGRAGCE